MINVPKKALCDKGEDGSENYPEVGDQIDLGDVMGTVKAVNGDTYQLEVNSVRGEDIVADSPKEDEAAKDDASEDAAEDESDGLGMAGAEMPKNKEGLALRRKVAGMDKRKYS